MRIKFLNIPIDAITMKDTINLVEKTIVAKKQIHHTVVNVSK